MLVAVGDREYLFEHSFELDAFETYRGGFDREGAWAEGLGFEAIAFEFFRDFRKGDELCGKEID